MAGRKFNFEHLGEKDIEAIEKMYPQVIETVTIRRPIYRKLAMLIECGAPLPEGVKLVADNIAAQNIEAARSEEPPLPPALRNMKRDVA